MGALGRILDLSLIVYFLHRIGLVVASFPSGNFKNHQCPAAPFHAKCLMVSAKEPSA